MPGRLVWLNGQSAAGKSWMGDYLATHHGFQHIDGDEEVHMYNHATGEGDLELKSIVEGFHAHFADNVFEGKGAGPDDLWQPFYSRVVDRIKAKRHVSPDADLAVGLATYPRVVRDFIRDQMAAPVTFVALTQSVEDRAIRAVPRIAKFREAQNMSDEEAWKMIVNQKFPDKPYEGEAGWIKHFMEVAPPMIDTFEESDDHIAVIPTKEREEVPRQVEEALGFTPYSGPVDIEAICQINYDRYQAYAEERKRRAEKQGDAK